MIILQTIINYLNSLIERDLSNKYLNLQVIIILILFALLDGYLCYKGFAVDYSKCL